MIKSLLGSKFTASIHLFYYTLSNSFLFILNIVGFSFFIGQALSQTNVEKELKRLNAKLDQIAVQIDSLDNQNSSLISSSKNVLKGNTLSQVQLDSLYDNIVKVVNNLNVRINLLEDKTNYIENNILTLSNTYKELSSLDTQKEKKKPLKKLTPDMFKQKYNESLQYYQNGDFELAALGFSLLVVDDPLNPLADNSQYWLGECYYSRMDFEMAISEFEKVKSYSDTDKDDDAQLKIGMSYIAMENKEKAKHHFEKFLSVYPESEYTIIVQELVQESLMKITLE